MEGSDVSFVFGLFASTAIVLALTAWIHLAVLADDPLPADSGVLITVAP